MDIDAIKSELDYEVAMQDAISDAGIPVCFVGVRALNYYNVRRSVREGYDLIELCVPSESMDKAASALEGLAKRVEEKHGLGPVRRPLDYPGFQNVRGLRFYNGGMRCPYPELDPLEYRLLPDTLFGFGPLQEVLIPKEAHREDSVYSFEALDFYSLEGDVVPDLPVIPRLNFPRLGPFFNAHLYAGSSEHRWAFPSEAICLVDAMDLDEQWCETHIPDDRVEELARAKKMVAMKSDRVGWHWPGKEGYTEYSEGVTVFLKTEAAARRIRLVPGRDI